jgi:antitoxin CcdA
MAIVTAAAEANMPIEHYRAKNGEFHRPCPKAECHRAFDETVGDYGVKQQAVLQMAKVHGIKESSARTWASKWSNPNYHGPKKRSDGSGGGPNSGGGLSESRAPCRETAISSRSNRESRAAKTIEATVDADVAAEAKAMNLDVARILEDELRKRIKDERGRRWTEENKAFIESYNAYVERNGVFGEDLLDLDDPSV